MTARASLLLCMLCGCGDDRGATPISDAGSRAAATECTDDSDCGPGGVCRLIGSASQRFGFCYPENRGVCSASLCCSTPYQCLGSAFGQREGYCFTEPEALAFCARMPPGAFGCITTGTVVYVPCRQ